MEKDRKRRGERGFRGGGFVQAFISTPERCPKGSGPKPIVSAFDDAEGYDLTELGKQFVHYARTELPPKIEFSDESLESEK